MDTCEETEATFTRCPTAQPCHHPPSCTVALLWFTITVPGGNSIGHLSHEQVKGKQGLQNQSEAETELEMSQNTSSAHSTGTLAGKTTGHLK